MNFIIMSVPFIQTVRCRVYHIIKEMVIASERERDAF